MGEKTGFFKRLVEGLTKTRNNIVSGIDSIFSGFSAIDEDFYEEIEEILIMGDLGINATTAIIEDLKQKFCEMLCLEIIPAISARKISLFLRCTYYDTKLFICQCDFLRFLCKKQQKKQHFDRIQRFYLEKSAHFSSFLRCSV